MDVTHLSAHAPVFTPSGFGSADTHIGARRRGGDVPQPTNIQSGRGRRQLSDDYNGPASTSEPAQQNRDRQGQAHRGRQQRQRRNETHISLDPSNISPAERSQAVESQAGGAPSAGPAQTRVRGGGRGRGRGRDYYHGRLSSDPQAVLDLAGYGPNTDPYDAGARWGSSTHPVPEAPSGPQPGPQHSMSRNDDVPGPSGRSFPAQRRNQNQRPTDVVVHGQGSGRHVSWTPMETPAGGTGYDNVNAGFEGGAEAGGGDFSHGRGGRGPEQGGRGGSRGRGNRERMRATPTGFRTERVDDAFPSDPGLGSEAVWTEPVGDVRPRGRRNAGDEAAVARGRGRGRGRVARGGGGGGGRASDDHVSSSTMASRSIHHADSGADGADAADAAAAAAAAVAAAAAAGAGGGGSDSDSDGETLTCVICCEEVTAVALGGCGHSHTCAKCCLRLRLCYRDLRCPMCKAVNKEVVVARPPLPPGATFESLAASPQQRELLWQAPKWAKGVLVYDSPAPAAAAAAPSGVRRRPLSKSLLAMTSRSCCVCDSHGRRPFGTMNLLLGHLRSAHDRMLCEVCLGAGLRFPLEYPAYDSAGLAAHMAAEHPRCEYCDLAFYGKDELYGHMTQRHFTCHVCSRLGRQHLYFPDADTLLVHLREEHHACDHPDCFGCMIAFATRDELTAHIRDRHSSYMPRWDQSRARPLLLDFITPRGPAAAAALAGPAAGGRNDRRGRGDGAGAAAGAAAAGGGGGGAAAAGNTGRASASAAHSQRPGRSTLQDPDAFPSLQAQVPLHQTQRQVGLGDVHDSEGGLAVIDDDVGLGARPSRGAAAAGAGGGSGGGALGREAEVLGPGPGPASGAGARLAGVWAGRTPGSGTFREDFPELSSAAAAAAAGPGPRPAWGAGPGAGGPPGPGAGATPSAAAVLSLRKVTVRCPCGNRLDHLALRSDEKPPHLACDRDCVAKQRRAQLADAFGVEAADSHVPYFDRHRTPNYTSELILAAQAAGSEWVASLERDLARFLADASARRTSLQPGMSQAQRKLVHELAAHYGLASHSVGQGAFRAVQLLKGASSGVPTRLLSVMAAATPPEELVRLAAGGGGGGGAGGGGWVLRLVDVAPGANVQHYLRTWEGEYTMTPVSSSSAASASLQLTFTREGPFRDCCARLGGGIRGVFRTVVERERQPAAAATATTAAAPSAAAAAAPPPPPPPGWQVLRGKVPAAGGAARRAPAAAAGTASGVGDGGDAAASVRAVLAADAWASDEDERTRQPQSLQHLRQRQPPADAPSAASGVGPSVGSRAGTGPQLPGRGPPLDLAKATLWSALAQEEGEREEGDGGGDEDEGEQVNAAGRLEAEGGCRVGAGSRDLTQLAAAGERGDGEEEEEEEEEEESWEDAAIDGR